MEQPRSEAVLCLPDPAFSSGEPSLSAGTRPPLDADQRISAFVQARLDQMCESAAAGELFDVDVHTRSGVVHLRGTTNSRALYQRLIDLIPVMQASIAGRCDIDIGGVLLRAPGRLSGQSVP
jgi:hypothetical protein